MALARGRRGVGIARVHHLQRHVDRGQQARSSAIPFPAISKAVPWSTEVRMIGRPTLTLTPLVEGQQLHRDVALVVVHRDDDVVGAFGRAQKDRVGRLRVGDVQPRARAACDRRQDPRALLSPNRPPSPACGFSPATAIRGAAMPSARQASLRQLDRRQDALAA